MEVETLNSGRWQMMPNYRTIMHRLKLKMLKVESFSLFNAFGFCFVNLQVSVFNVRTSMEGLG
jgi:hypothetical protein